MASQQQFCLKWNNHTNNMVKVFSQLLDDENFVDVTLACEGSSIRCHKIVLSACSSYFKELFVDNPCKHPIVILKDMRYEDLKAIVNFMYCGQVNVSQSQLGALLKTAEVLKVKGLTDVNDKQTDSLNPNDNKLNDSLTPQQTSTSATASNAAFLSSRKKRKKRGNQQNPTSMSGDSENDSSQSDHSSDEASNKKVKEASGSTDSSKSAKETKNTTKIVETPVSNMVQMRRRQALQQHTETDTNRDQSDSLNTNNDQRVNNGNQSDAWQTNAQLVLALPSGETEDESEDMFDVKPIISFDESSVPASNAIALREDSSLLMTSPSDTNVLAGSSNAQTGKICVCHLCHLTFTAYSSLRRHMARHYADRERYECEICLKSYSRKDYLKEHKKLKHALG